MKNKHSHQAARRAQQGFSLITAAVFLIALLLVSLSALRVSTIGERMIGNDRDKELAMQAAEATLRDAEQDINLNIGNDLPVAAVDCAGSPGYCLPPNQRATVNNETVERVVDWTDDTSPQYRYYGQSRGLSRSNYTADFNPEVQRMEYVIEDIGVASPLAGRSSGAVAGSSGKDHAFRITAYATGKRADTVVILQSIYIYRP